VVSPHRYKVFPKSLGGHLFEVSLTVAEPDPAGQLFSMPAWIPGSYMIRDFARHVVAIRAESEGQDIGLQKTDKSSWLADPCAAPITIIAEVYAHDLSVRGAHLDTTHAYFNGPCIFLRVDGQEQSACEVELLPPADPVASDWRVATSMRARHEEQYAFGEYYADSYDELIDHPVEIGHLMIGEFEAGGIPHAIAIHGQSKVDMGRICKDLSQICETHLQLLGKPADLDRYLFLLMVPGDGYGGLEHRWSSSLVCSRRNLPHRGEIGVSDGYRKFLGLCSHEYFHLWNVKRMKPEKFTPYDLQSESHTGLLWVFEGITSYYDDLALVRSGLISDKSYLELLGKTITRVIRGHGRFYQSIEESSFDAWTKFYKQEANSSNAIVSYYAKGSLVALALDLMLRSMSGNDCSLDDVMRECWRLYGESGEGMPEGGLESVAAKISGLDLADFFDKYVRGTSDLPLGPMLSEVGIQYHIRVSQGQRDMGGKRGKDAKGAMAWLGATLTASGGQDVFGTIHSLSPAEKAGLAAGDVAVAMDNLQLTARNIDDRLQEYRPGDQMILTVFRRDELMRFRVSLQAPPADTCYLLMKDDCAADKEQRRQDWLAGAGL
jgi:predicted metalloprotease with PDZ domain